MKRLAALFLALAPLPAQAASPAGGYDGSQMEMVVGLKLGEDGRFEFGLIYGALGEQAQGRWTDADGAVLLTSDPVTPPRFVFLDQKPAGPNELSITLDLPEGISRQYFDGVLLMRSGETDVRQFAEEGLSLEFDPGFPPVEVAVQLRMYELASDPVKIDPAKGYGFAFRFEPNDIGKVAFERQALRKDGADLLLERHGRLIRFRHIEN